MAAYEIVGVVKTITFEHVAELFQGFVNFSPRKVQSLLERSQAVQTNRIFLFLSHYYNHQWIKHLNEANIKLGSGKRQVVKDGVFDEHYQITVPAAFKEQNVESPYYKQVELLIKVLPIVANESIFALKGGTAINLFIRDFSRLSVDKTY